MMKNAYLAAGLATGLVASGATAGLVASFGFTDLNASFNTESGVFTAVSDSMGGLNSSGDVTFYGPSGSTAVFGPGFAGGSSAYAEFTMTIASVNGNEATAVDGTFLIVDADGDTLSGTFDGTWAEQFGFAFFGGQITSAAFDGANGNGTFDGPDGGSFDNLDGALFGALSMLKFQLGDDLFASNFDGRAASVDGMLVPAPGALGLLCLGGMVAGRRRR